MLQGEKCWLDKQLFQAKPGAWHLNNHISQMSDFPQPIPVSLTSPNKQHVLEYSVWNTAVIIIRVWNNGGDLNGGRLKTVRRRCVFILRWQLKLNEQLSQKHWHDGLQ